MRRTLAAIIAFGIWILTFAATPPAGSAQSPSTDLVPTRPRCEGIDNPLGIESQSPRLSWQLRSDTRGQRQTAYRILVASTSDNLTADQGDLWDSGRISSSETTHIAYAGRRIDPSQQVFWKVRAWDMNGAPSPWSAPVNWTQGLAPDQWRAQWIVPPWETEGLLVRREFNVRPGLARAVVHLVGLGQYELFVNGAKVSDDLLVPGWTMFNRTILYDTRDLTPSLRPGPNALGLSLGDGQYHSQRLNRFNKHQHSFGSHRVVVQLELFYRDGSRDSVLSDSAWRVTPGPVMFTDIYGGEDYDARRSPAGWSRPGFDDAEWASAELINRPGGTLRGVESAAPPLRAFEALAPAAIIKTSETRHVIDFGQNTAAMPRITVSGPRGSTIRLAHAELLNRDGSIDRSNVGGRFGSAYWQYTKSTDAPETWFPQFFYAGYRYLQLDRIPARPGGPLPALDAIHSVVVHSDSPRVGAFDCSNPLLGRIRTLIDWAIRSNMVSYLTDCPHREKYGWLEQYHLMGPSLRFEFDVTRLFVKGMRDMADSQRRDGLLNGLIPTTAPEYEVFGNAFSTYTAAAEWGAAFIIVPWQQYRFTGDTRLIAEYYDAMKGYMDYLESRASKDQILAEGLGDWADLPPRNRGGNARARLTPPEITATAFYYRDAELMARYASMLGKTGDAAYYTKLAGEIRDAWRAKFRNADTGTYATGSQCSNAIALVMGLAVEQDRPRTLEALVRDVRDNGNVMTAGDVGFRYLVKALADGGRSDVVYDMINRPDGPGYGEQFTQGATSLTESWTASRGASQNHFMLGHILEWFYQDLVGIAPDPDTPGFRNVIINPQPVGDLTWAEASYDSIRGPISVRWEREGEKFTLRCRIPANATATLRLPAREGGAILEGNRPVAGQAGIQLVSRTADRATFKLVSGTYTFRSTFVNP